VLAKDSKKAEGKQLVYLALVFADGENSIIECADIADPRSVASDHGATMYDVCHSKDEAERTLCAFLGT